MNRYLDFRHVGPSEERVRKLYASLIAYFIGCKSVLDLGCGRGVFLEMFRDLNIPAVGCDSDFEMVKECLRKGLVCFHVDAIEFLRNTQDEFDSICCGHLIEHLPPSAALELLKLCYRKLESNGRLLIVTPNPEDLSIISFLFWVDLAHVRPYPSLLLQEMLKHVGFSIEKSYDLSLTLGNRRVYERLPRLLLKKLVRVMTGIDFLYRENTVVLARK